MKKTTIFCVVNLLGKPFILVVLFLLLSSLGTANAQVQPREGLIRQQEQASEALVRQHQQARTGLINMHRDARSRLDSLNQRFAEDLARDWRSFDLTKSEPPIRTPILEPPVFDPETDVAPEPIRVPIARTPQPPPAELQPRPVELPVITPTPTPIPLPPVQQVFRTTFFGTAITLPETPRPNIRLAGVSEREVADYWLALSNLPYYTDWLDEALRLKSELRLNDWGLFQLLNNLFSVYFPQGNENEQVVFSVFMLNQLGYRARIGRSANELFALVAFRQMVFNTTFFTIGGTARYFVVNPNQRDLSSIRTTPINHGGAELQIDMALPFMPRFAHNIRTRTLMGMPLQYNRNLVDFLATYPTVYFPIFAEADICEVTWRSIEAHIAPQIRGMSQENAVNWLLNFVQRAFDYKTDQDNYGFERWNFAEQTLASRYSDCDDRSFLFAQLVRRLLNMPVVLVLYPDIHLATAVRFDNPNIRGDYLIINGQRYLICDPTFIGARLGMAMPNLRHIPVQYFRVAPFRQ